MAVEASLGKAVVEKCGNIAPASGYGHNLYWPGCGSIEDEVSAHRPEQNRVSGQIFALMADPGVLPIASNASNNLPIQSSAASLLS